MSQEPLHLHQKSAAARGASPWTVGQRVKMVLWEFTWNVLCAWTPKPANAWRLAVLRWFGADIRGRPFVHQRARIQIPWNVELHDRACVGDRTHLYSVARITLGPEAVAAQESYLCAATHDFGDPTLPLMSAPIAVGARAFIGARAFVMPGLTIGEGAVVGACAVVTKSVEPGATVAGNPAGPLRTRR